MCNKCSNMHARTGKIDGAKAVKLANHEFFCNGSYRGDHDDRVLRRRRRWIHTSFTGDVRTKFAISWGNF